MPEELTHTHQRCARPPRLHSSVYGFEVGGHFCSKRWLLYSQNGSDTITLSLRVIYRSLHWSSQESDDTAYHGNILIVGSFEIFPIQTQGPHHSICLICMLCLGS